jgi:hypothetical protein
MRAWIITVEILFALGAAGQETDALERLQEGQERTIETESLQQEKQYRLRHPLSLNTATAEELLTLGVSVMQAQSLIAHRRQLGALLAVEELQAVPCWDTETIVRIRPYVTIQDAEPIATLVRQFRGGDHQVVLRYGRSIPLPEDATKWAGSADRFYIRYRYRHNGGLRWGVTAEKDAGEPLFSKGRTFDFISVHLSGQGKGLLRQWALGDFQINSGQGLAHWQGLAFGPGADLSLLKRQGPVLQPYLSGNEFSFYRGGAFTLQQHAWSLTGWTSLRHIDASLLFDSSGAATAISSLQTTGYHRTSSEIRARKAVRLLSWGARLQWEPGALKLGMQSGSDHFSMPLLPGTAPYQHFAPSGRTLSDLSFDWSGTWRNLHFFGELAFDRKGNTALLQGLLFSGGTRWDGALVYRRYAPGYAQLYGNALGHWSNGQNETGVYLGLQLRPGQAWVLSAWADAARAPWLRYRLDAPSGAFEAGMQAAWHPFRKLETDIRFRFQDDDGTTENISGVIKAPVPVRRSALRLQVKDERSSRLTGTVRSEALWQEGGGSGYVLATGIRYQIKQWGSLSMRVHFFDTDGYDLRIYQFDADGGGGGTILPLYGQGKRCSLLYQLNRGGIGISIRWAATLLTGDPGTNTAAEAGLRSDWKTQLRFGF